VVLRATDTVIGPRYEAPVVFSGPFPPDDEEDAAAQRKLRDGLGEISPDVLRTFVVLALVVQAGLFAASLGLMLLWFRGQRLLGGGLAVAGVLALGASAVIYRQR
jgi:hypothetical protein